GQRLRARNARVPGDISSAAFAAVAAAALPGSDVTIEGVGLNPSRTGLLDVLRRFGVVVDVDQTDVWQEEAVGQIRVRAQGLGALELGADIVPGLIDELPILAVLATSGGELRVTGAAELRVKESDRIAALITGLRALGADAEELPDGFHVRGRGRLTGGVVHAHDDHRLAMAFAIAGLTATGPVTVEGADAAAVSYPSFFTDLDRLRA
ncbi:MAG: 3-phosphoshikimate 1-carboxyvinyltransferase, partial [Dongiaceae bacterium]